MLCAIRAREYWCDRLRGNPRGVSSGLPRREAARTIVADRGQGGEMRRALAGCAVALSLATTWACAQNCFWSHVDHEWNYDVSGAWNPSTYRGLVTALTVAEVGGALWEGADTRFGKTMWQGMDSEIISYAGAAAGKYVFTRVRPAEENNPCLWFKGKGNYSFPSGEAAVAAGLVTPYVIEYAGDYPAVYGLLLLPLYVGVGRVKNPAHRQTVVVAGWPIGGLSGWDAHARDVPILVQVLPHGVTVGLHAQF
jgi:undecaprenyl-diphosphatase